MTDNNKKTDENRQPREAQIITGAPTASRDMLVSPRS
jgi:hypothetical protein